MKRARKEWNGGVRPALNPEGEALVTSQGVYL